MFHTLLNARARQQDYMLAAGAKPGAIRSTVLSVHLKDLLGLCDLPPRAIVSHHLILGDGMMVKRLMGWAQQVMAARCLPFEIAV